MRRASYLTSAKLEGRSTIRAPPNSGVLVKDDILFGLRFDAYIVLKLVSILEKRI